MDRKRAARLERVERLGARLGDRLQSGPGWDALPLDDPEVAADMLLLVDAGADPLAQADAARRLLAGLEWRDGAVARELVEEADQRGEHLPAYVRRVAETAPARDSHLGTPTAEVLEALAELRARYSVASHGPLRD